MRKIKSQLLLLILLFLLTAINFYPQSPIGKYQSTPKEIEYLGYNILRIDDSGNLVCQEMKREEREERESFLLNANTQPHLTVVNSLNNPNSVRGLKVLLRATDQLLNNKEALLAFRRAAARWERFIQTKITVVIDVDYGTTRWGEPWAAGVLGSTNSAYKIVLFQNGDSAKVTDIVQALKLKHPADAQLQALYNAIPIPTPSSAGTNLNCAVGGLINFQELGLLNAEINPDPQINPLGSVPSIGFNSSFSFDMDPSDGISLGWQDFDAVVTHEIGHALGFNSIIGNGGAPTNYFTPWDLFRVRPDSVEPNNLDGFKTTDRIITPGPPSSIVQVTENGVKYFKSNQVFFDGLNEIELSTATGSRVGGDGQQASHWRDDDLRPPSLGDKRHIGIMDPTANAGTREEIGINDLRMLEVIGYEIDYQPSFASVMLVQGSDTLDLDKSQDTIKIKDVPLNGSKMVSIKIINLDLNNMLNYETEIEIITKRPEDASADISVDALSGSIGSGGNTTINLVAANATAPSIFFGILRIHTNDENKLVIDIPFKVSVGGAIEPTIVTDKTNLGNFVFDNKSGSQLSSKELTIKNFGNLPLEYRLLLSLTDKSNRPYDTRLKKTSGKYENNILSHFYSAEALDDAVVLFNADFETDFNEFTFKGINSEDWHRITTGPSLLDGHSKPTSAHFGIDYIDSIKYRNYSDVYLTSKSFDLSKILPEDLVTLSFNYYLQAEEGYDFASVLISIDGGKSFEEVATSNGGIIKNDSVWQSVSLQLPYLSGNTNPVQFAFRFTSDQLIEKEGWFIDDVQLSVIKNSNSYYTDVKGGKITGLNETNLVKLFVNSQKIAAGYYKGSLSMLSNDPVKPEFSVPFAIKNFTIEPVQKNVLYASTGRGTAAKGKLLIINKNTGAGTEIGTSGFEPLKSITISPESHELYGLNASTFIPSSIVLVNSQDGYGLFKYESSFKLSAIVFDDKNNLYAASDDKKLFKLNIETGDSTFIGEIGFKVGAMTIEPKTGNIIASVDASSNKDKLYRIDVNTADTFYIGKTGLGKITRGLVFDEKGNLYGVVGEDTQSSTFLSIDMSTGLATQIGDVAFRGVMGLAMYADTTTGVLTNKTDIPVKLMLDQNYPNPFNPSTSIKYNIPENGFVKLMVFDILGREVKALVNGNRSAGSHIEKWNATNFASGLYFYQLEFTAQGINKTTLRKKMVLTK
ncbi:MAG: NF038122 family metalloprotease [Ignavibacteriales bacterium]|nr:NF038122 family metalloprotease [Ignavibacteriales bacterium]